MIDRDLAFTPAWKLREMVVSRQVSPVELVELYLRRIEALNPKLNAYLTVAADEALADAASAERTLVAGAELGPLFGVPIAVKDLELTRGIRTTAGSLLFQDRVPVNDSIVVERVRRTGAIIIGKTNTPELALFPRTENRLCGPCVNPWDTTRTVGGSSGGSGAALAAGLCPIATGSDGGGSTRMPCSFTGTFGFKPTQGRIPRYGGYGKPAPNQFAQSGPMSHTVRDSAILFQALAGFDARDPISLRGPAPDVLSMLDKGVKGLRIGWSGDLGYAAVDPEVVKAARGALKALEAQGARIGEFTLEVGEPWPPFWAIYQSNSYLSYGFLLEEHAQGLTDYVREALQMGRQITGWQYAQGIRYVEGLRCRSDEVMAQFDLLVTPATAAPAFPSGKPSKAIAGRAVDPFWGHHPHLFPFNMTGQPAASVPCCMVRGLPVGVQVVGRRGDDALVFQAAAALEKALPWADRHPAVS